MDITESRLSSKGNLRLDFLLSCSGPVPMQRALSGRRGGSRSHRLCPGKDDFVMKGRGVILTPGVCEGAFLTQIPDFFFFNFKLAKEPFGVSSPLFGLVEPSCKVLRGG